MQKLSRTMIIVGLALLLLVPDQVEAKKWLSSSIPAKRITGIRIGYNLASFSEADHANMLQRGTNPGVPKDNTFNGFSGGVFAFSSRGGILGFQTELAYTMKGAHFEVKDHADGTLYTYTFRNAYAELDLLLKARIPFGEAFGNAFFGPYMAGLLSSDLDLDIDGEVETYQLGGYNKFDYGLTFGAGFDFPLGGSLFIFDARFSVGLADLLSRPDGYSESEWDEVKPGFKNSIFSLGLGISF